MRYYLGPWVQGITPFLHWRAPVGAVGCIDLRSLPAHSTPGVGFFATPDAVTLGVEYIEIGQGDLRSIVVSALQRSAIAGRFGLGTVSGTTLADCLLDLLTLRADPTGVNRCKPLMPTIQGNLEIHLGGHSLVTNRKFDLGIPEAVNVIAVIQEDYRTLRAAALRGETADPEIHRRVLDALGEKFRINNPEDIFIPADLPKETKLPHGTTRSDDFNRANSAALGTSSEGWSWTEVLGVDWGIAGNRANIQAANAAFLGGRADADLAGADHYSEATIAAFTHSSDNAAVGVQARCRSSDDQAYFFRAVNDTTPALKFELYENLGTETFTLLGEHAQDPAVSDLIRVEVNGSTIIGKVNGATLVSVSDTSITGHLRGGITGHSFVGTQVLELDSWVAADLVVAARPSFREISHRPRPFAPGIAR
jgi:hypothetical protein